MSQQLLDLNSLEESTYQSIYDIEDQNKKDFINYIENKIMKNVKKLLKNKDKEIDEIINNIAFKDVENYNKFKTMNEKITELEEIICTQTAEINELNEKCNLQNDMINKLREKVNANELMTDGIFETLTEKIDNNYLSIKETDKITRGLYSVHNHFIYDFSQVPKYTHIFTEYLFIESFVGSGRSPCILNLNILRLPNLKYIKTNLDARLLNDYKSLYTNHNCYGMGKVCQFRVKFNINHLPYYDDLCEILRKNNYDFNSYDISLFCLLDLLKFNKVFDYKDRLLNFDKFNDEISRDINSENHKILKNALIECGYITI
jgi:hypothetical protein